MTKKILVTGGTGVLGRVVVDRLLGSGHEVGVASRRERPAGTSTPYEWSTVDYRDGQGLAAAVEGADAVVHCAGAGKGAGAERRLAAAMTRAGCPHLVYISIVGVDRVPFGFYGMKLAAERVIEGAGVPWTILRTTQFHDLIRLVLALTARSPLMPIPSLSFQPIEVGEVATRLAELALGEPAGRVPDMGGPETLPMRELADTYLRITDRRRAKLPIRLPGKAFRAYSQGKHLTPENSVGKTTFEEYLLGQRDPRTTSYRGRR